MTVFYSCRPYIVTIREINRNNYRPSQPDNVLKVRDFETFTLKSGVFSTTTSLWAHGSLLKKNTF